MLGGRRLEEGELGNEKLVGDAGGQGEAGEVRAQTGQYGSKTQLRTSDRKLPPLTHLSSDNHTTAQQERYASSVSETPSRKLSQSNYVPPRRPPASGPN